MKFLKQILSGTTAVALACAMTACGGEDEEPEVPTPPGGEDNPGWVDPSPSAPVLTDEEAKEYLGATAEILAEKCNPDDHKRVINVAGAFTNYEDYGIEGMDDDEEDYAYSRGIASFFKTLKQALSARDFAGMSRAAIDVVTFGDFTGIYEPDDERELFCLKGQSENLVIRFYNAGALCELTVKRNGSASWSLDINDATEGEIGKAAVPASLSFTLTERGEQLASGTVDSNWADGSSMTVKADVTAANVRAVTDFSSSNTTATNNESLYIDGELINTSAATVNGSGMVSAASLKQLMKEETDSWEGWDGTIYEESWYEFDTKKASEIFKSGSVDANVLGRVRVVSEIPATSAFVDVETYFDSEDYDSEDEARTACQAACNKMATACNTQFYMNDYSSNATLAWQPARDGDNYWWEWYPEPVVSFPDGSTYSMEEFAEAGLSSVSNRVMSVISAYEKLFNAAFDLDD